ncbi:MAG TPA: 50S ribosomal protein L25/general stress protein Ctc [Sphingomonadaceae bacterium]|nr:50S ribosomal protein L25/general stress protein Ctc [Sphingomonadaceae bacterium]
MSEQLTLTAETRDRAGKGASRAHRRDGRVPAVIYGAGEAPASIHVEEKVLVKAMSGGHFMNSVVMIEAGGAPVRTLPKAVQFHPVTDRPIHVDFLRIGLHSKVTVSVPFHFVDEDQSPGMTSGGVLNVVSHDLEISVDASDIPGEIRVSLAGLDVGGSIHLSDVTMPAGATATSVEADQTIATLVASSSMMSENDEANADAAADAVPSDNGSAVDDAARNADQKGGTEQ